MKTGNRRTEEVRTENSSQFSLLRFFSGSRQTAIFDAMRLVGVVSERRFLSASYSRVIAVEKVDFRVAFERQNVRRDAVEKPAVVADDDGAAREIFQRFFERAHRVDVQIVGRLVEQNHVRAGLEHFRQMHAVALAAGKLPDAFLLVGAGKIKPRNVGARIHFAFAELNQIQAVGDLVPDSFVGVQRIARLVNVAELDGFADFENRPRPALSCSVIRRKSVVLPAPFGPMTPTMPPRGRLKIPDFQTAVYRRKPFETPCASMTISPRRSPGGIKISKSSARFSDCLRDHLLRNR